MNFTFHGPAKACWIMGLVLIMISAVNDVLGGRQSLIAFVLLGAVSIGCAFFLRSRSYRG
ncbi:hypothetical protein [Sphingomonas sp. NBWT7]|uniref:hypothetical protein n=1 Tax=Sphingomonas sp. NBWT7 TaxID=2596913 RepID=UPI001627D404|nr:hypothetical protein [Sphingomonas sp. NBWT7]